MTTSGAGGQTTQAVKESTGQVAGTTREEAGAVASTAAGAAGQVAATAKEQVGEVAGEAVRQARDLAGEARGQLQEQVTAQRDRAITTLRGMADELRDMVEGRGGQGGLASELAEQVSDRVQRLAGYLDTREPGALLDEVRDFARRRPGAFLAGAATLGVLVGRFTKGVKSPSESGSDFRSEYQYRSTPLPATPPTAPVTAPPPPPLVRGTTGTAAGQPLSGVGETVTLPEGTSGSRTTEPYPGGGYGA